MLLGSISSSGINIDSSTMGIYILLGILVLIVIICLAQVGSMKRKYNSFMRGTSGKNLEKIFVNRLDKLEGVELQEKENKELIQNIGNTLQTAITKIGLVKYDALDEMGGRLSFSLALLDQKDDGVVINAIHSREGCYTYIKEIIRGNSAVLLSNEDKQAVDIAIHGEEKE